MVAINIIVGILMLILPLCLMLRIKDNVWLYVFIWIYAGLFVIIPLFKYSSNNFDEATIAAYKGIDDPEHVRHFILFATCYYLFIIIGYIISKRKKEKISTTEPMDVNRLVVVFSLLSLLGSIGWVYFSGMSLSTLISGTRFEYWETKSALPQNICSYLKTLLAVPAFLYGFIEKRKTKLLFHVALIAMVVNLMASGSRTAIISVFGAFLLGQFFYRKSKMTSIRGKMRFLFLGILSFHISVVWQYVRYMKSGFSEITDWITAIFFDIPSAYQLSLQKGDLSYFFDSAVTAFHVVPSLHNFLY